MKALKLALISAAALAIAHAGDALAQESNQQHNTHHEDAGSSSSESAEKSGADDSVEDAAAMGVKPTDDAGMMMCGRMMAMMGEMMKGGGMHSRSGDMKGGDKPDMMKHQMSMMDDHRSGRQGKAGMAHHGFARLLSAEEVGKQLASMVAHNKRLKVGTIGPGGDFSFAAEITTVDGSVVHKLLIDRRDGTAWETE